MKSRIIAWLLFISAFTFSACNSNSTENSKLLVKTKQVEPFTELSIEAWLPIELVEDATEAKVVVSAPKSIQDDVTIEQEGNKLFVKMEDAHHLSDKGARIIVYSHGLTKFSSNSVGTIKTRNTLLADSLELNIKAVGKSEFDLKARFVRANLESVGENTFTGSVDEFRVNNKGVGKLDAYGLNAKVLMIHNNSIGEALVKADSLIYIRSSAIGTLHYKGNAVVKELESEGLGKVKKDE